MIRLTKSFLSHYPDAYVDHDFVVTKRGRAIYHPTQRMMLRWDVGFADPVNDPYTLVRYSVYPCDVQTTSTGDEWIASEITPTYTSVVSVESFNRMMRQCLDAGYRVLHCDASTNRDLVTTDAPNERLQSVCDRARFKRTMRANGFV